MMAGGRSRTLSIWLAALGMTACAGQRPEPVPVPPAAGAVEREGATPDGAGAQPARPSASPKRRPAAKAPARPVRPLPDSAALEARIVAVHAHEPLARVLARRTGNRAIAGRVAMAVVREAQRARLSPSLVAGVLLVENAPLDTTAVSRAGAIGLMQVMPFHAGGWGCPSAELSELEANICHGTRVLRTYVRRSRSLQGALRRYNGCVGKLATPRCRRYPDRVLRTAASVRREMLTLAAAPPARAAQPVRASRPAGPARTRPAAPARPKRAAADTVTLALVP